MASIRFVELQARPTEFLDFTSLTLEEFQQLVPPFEAAFHAHMVAWCLDGQPRTARQFSVYQNGVYSGALVGFQGRGCADGVRPALCHALILEALIFQ